VAEGLSGKEIQFRCVIVENKDTLNRMIDCLSPMCFSE